MSDRPHLARWSVPPSWSWTLIGDVCEVVGGGTPSTKDPRNFAGGDIPWITPADLSGYSAKYIEAGARSITKAGLEGSGARIMPAGTILFSSRAPIGYVAIAQRAVTTNQGFKSFVPPEGISSDYLYHYLRYSKPLALELSSGTTFQEISGKNAAQIPLAVAPHGEQQRIVEKLEELLSDLDAGVSALERARANLKRYRAAVLKSAVEGRLTEQWRAAHSDVEPASKLLERIMAERRKRWEEAQLKKYAEDGQSPPKGWKDKYSEPVRPNIEGLSELPRGWCWATLDQLTVNGPQNGLYLPRDKYGREGTPILRIDDYQNFWSRSSSEMQRVRTSVEQCQTYGLRLGDLVVNRVNSPSHLGKCLVVDARHVPAVFESNMMRIELAPGVAPSFVATALRTVEGKARLTRRAKWAVNQASINQQDVRLTEVAIAPVKEQEVTMQVLDEQLSALDRMSEVVEHRSRHANRLRQGILKRAFEGKLVPQDPKDEPASELLARIRAARAGEGKAKGRTRRGIWGAGARKTAGLGKGVLAQDS